MEVTCYAKNEASPDEPCASGPACNGCNVWSEVNGVKYCCANNCDYGYVEVSYENGNVVCHCHHWLLERNIRYMSDFTLGNCKTKNEIKGLDVLSSRRLFNVLKELIAQKLVS